MNLASLRVISNDIKGLVQFYEKIIELPAKWYTEDFAEINAGSCTLAIASERTMTVYGDQPIARPASNQSTIIEFRVNDVDKEYERIKESVSDLIQEPTTMPWGNRSLLFRDPEGNLINFFAPVNR